MTRTVVELRGEPPMPMTMRERQVLAAYIVKGSSARAADFLGIAPNTVKNHLSAIYRKTNSHNIVQALWRMGYIDDAAVTL